MKNIPFTFFFKHLPKTKNEMVVVEIFDEKGDKSNCDTC